MKKQFPSFWHLTLILLYFIIFSLPFGLLQPILPNNLQVWLMFFGYVIPMLLTIWATRQTFNKRGTINYKVGYLELLPLIIIVAYAFLVVGEFTIFLLPEPSGIWKKLFDMLNQSMKEVFNHRLVGFLMVAVAAPILEETLFRGIILKALLKKTSPYWAIMISAIAFGVFHMNPWQFLYATVLGLFLGYIYWKTRSLFYPILIHMLLNGTAFVAAQFANLDSTEGLAEQLSGKDLQQYLFLVSISLAIIIAAYFYFEKYFAKQPQPIVLATQNPHKIEEIKKILPENMSLQSLKDIRFKGQLKETGTTLEANALQKLRQISKPFDVDAIADDTGLEVEALNGAPGVYSARYAGDNASYADNVNKLLEAMKDQTDRSAQFKTVVAMSKGPKEHVVTGVLKGKIATEPRGEGGFGYDSVFIPEGYDQTFAEMDKETKNKISHRALALGKLKKLLNQKDAN